MFFPQLEKSSTFEANPSLITRLDAALQGVLESGRLIFGPRQIAEDVGISLKESLALLASAAEAGVVIPSYTLYCPSCSRPHATASKYTELPTDAFECLECGQRSLPTLSDVHVTFRVVAPTEDFPKVLS